MCVRGGLSLRVYLGPPALQGCVWYELDCVVLGGAPQLRAREKVTRMWKLRNRTMKQLVRGCPSYASKGVLSGDTLHPPDVVLDECERGRRNAQRAPSQLLGVRRPHGLNTYQERSLTIFAPRTPFSR